MTAANHDELSNSEPEQRVHWIVWVALAVVLVRLCIQPLNSSLWLDETGTFLLVQGTF